MQPEPTDRCAYTGRRTSRRGVATAGPQARQRRTAGARQQLRRQLSAGRHHGAVLLANQLLATRGGVAAAPSVWDAACDAVERLWHPRPRASFRPRAGKGVSPREQGSPWTGSQPSEDRVTLRAGASVGTLMGAPNCQSIPRSSCGGDCHALSTCVPQFGRGGLYVRLT